MLMREFDGIEQVAKCHTKRFLHGNGMHCSARQQSTNKNDDAITHRISDYFSMKP